MNWKIILILFLVSLVAIFILQNHEVTKVKFLLWTFEASRAMVLFLTLLIGVITGGVISFLCRRKNGSGIDRSSA